MSYLYVESSALVRALVEGDVALARRLAKAGRPVTSAITLLEVARAIARKAEDGTLSADQVGSARTGLTRLSRRTATMRVTRAILAEAASRFPVEPVRSLDAIHLASCVQWQRSAGRTTVASVDARVRANALALGMAVLPD